MLFLLFFLTTIVLLSFHYLLFTEKAKKYFKKLFGVFFITRLYRLLYAVVSLYLFFFIFSFILKLPYIEIINWQDSLNNITYLIIATIGGLISCFLMIESLWTIGPMNLLGFKQLFSKKGTNFYLDYIKQLFVVKGLYSRHRHPFFFYSIPFTIFVLPSFTSNNLIALIIVAVYYPLYAKMIEQQLLQVYENDFKKYRSKVNFFFPMLKKYQNEPTKE